MCFFRLLFLVIFFFFFLYNDIDTRKSCTKKIQSQQSVLLCIVKIRRDLGIGSESKVSVDVGLERLRLYVALKTVRRRELQSLEDIGINELANVFVRLVSNLSA